jgi:hypothetical protein
MKEGNCRVMLHREKPIRNRDVHSPANAHQFGDEETLIFDAADVLENRIRGDNVK